MAGTRVAGDVAVPGRGRESPAQQVDLLGVQPGGGVLGAHVHHVQLDLPCGDLGGDPLPSRAHEPEGELGGAKRDRLADRAAGVVDPSLRGDGGAGQGEHERLAPAPESQGARPRIGSDTAAPDLAAIRR
jgi:hypothetical protein